MKKTSAKKTEKKIADKGTVRQGQSKNGRGKAKNKSYNFVPFILLTVSLLVETLLIFHKEAGVVGGAVHGIFTGLFGAVAYLIPAGILVLGFCFFDIMKNRTIVLKSVMLALSALFFAAAHSIIALDTLGSASVSVSAYFDGGVRGEGGGLFGGLIGKLFVAMFGRGFGAAAAIIVCLCALAFFIGASPFGLWQYPARKVSEKLASIRSGRRGDDYQNQSLKGKGDARQNGEITVIQGGADASPVLRTDASPRTIETTISSASVSNSSFKYGSSLNSQSNTEPAFNIDLRNNDSYSEVNTASAPGSTAFAGRTSENPMTAGYTRIPTDKSGKPRAYSPFANPFVSMEDVFGKNAQTQKKQTQSSSADGKGRAYSPFADPIASMNDPRRNHMANDLPPQSYIACGASFGSGRDSSEKGSSDSSVHEENSSDSEVHRQGEAFSANIGGSGFSGNVSAAQSGSYNPTSAQTVPTAPIFRELPKVTLADDDYSEDVEDDDDDDDTPPFDMADEIPVRAATPRAELRRVTPAKETFFRDEPDEPDEEEYDRAPGCGYRSEPRYPDYRYPQFDLLEPQGEMKTISEEEILEIRNKILGKLESFRVKAELTGYSVGPTITRYELMPGPGVKVKQITSLIEDLSLELKSDGVRIATVPGKSVIGVEVPNEKVSVVALRSLIENRDFINAKSKITVCVGLTVTGKPVYMDIDDMPHVLIAGETKSGKSVAINCMILSLLYRASPDEVQLILIDPKRVELNIYSKVPHLVMPVIDDPRRAAAALQWAVNEMERRYILMDKLGVRDRGEYYELKSREPSLEHMPQIVVVIDELADLMLQVREHVEEQINRLAAKARACGIHLLVGTQRPSVDIITGLIKANIPARISFKVSSAADSRIILGGIGAEKLLGRGDMLYQATGAGRMRVQGAYVNGAEIKRVTKYIIDENGSAQFDPEVMHALDSEYDKMTKPQKKNSSYSADDDDDGVVDGYEPDFELLCRAIEYVIDSGKTATNNIQRYLRVGFNRAADIVDRMEELGFISAKNGSKPRDVLVNWEMYEEWKNNRMS